MLQLYNMKRIHFITILLLLLLLGSAAQAQERGDGLGNNDERNPHAIASGRIGAGAIVRGRNRWFENNLRYGRKTDGTLPFTPGITELGVKLGGNIQQMAHSPFEKQFSLGLIGGVHYRRYWRITGVKVELLGSSAHYTSNEPAAYNATTHPSDSVTKSSFRALYVSLPALGLIRAYKNIYLELGPQYTYMVSYADKNGAFSKIYKRSDIFYRSEFSGIIGAEARISHKFKADLRYIKGLTDVNNSVYPKAYLQWNINSVQATVMYRLN